MNIDNITLLTDTIAEQSDESTAFCMSKITHDFRSPSCIAGWVVALFDARHPFAETNRKYDEYIAARLGISRDAAQRLIWPENPSARYIAARGDPGWITVQHAVAVLRHLAKTGDVDWSVGRGTRTLGLSTQELIQ